MRPRLLLTLSLSLPLMGTACSPTGLAQISAEPTACPAERLEISEANQPMEGPSSWTATCTASDGAVQQKWFCSRAGMNQTIICTEDPR